jgi:lysophospholipase L1-like esterase
MPRRLLLLLALVAATAVVATMVEAALEVRELRKMAREARRRLHPFLQVIPSAELFDHVNAHGFRSDPIEVAKPDSAFRIFALGGSTTLSVRTSYESTYPAKLQALLRARYPARTIEVQNAASDWYTTAHSLVNYELRVRAFSPDLVIVFHAVNDLCRSFSPSWWATSPYQPDYGHYYGPLMRLRGLEGGFFDPPSSNPLANLLLWRKTKELFGTPSPYDVTPAGVGRLRAALRAVDVAPEDFRSLPSFRANLERLARHVRADGADVVLASQPSHYPEGLTDEERQQLFFGPVFCAENGTFPSDESMRRGMARYNEVARDVAAQLGTPFLDFDAAVPRTTEYFSDGVHMKDAAYEILARMAFDWIVGHGVIQ